MSLITKKIRLRGCPKITLEIKNWVPKGVGGGLSKKGGIKTIKLPIFSVFSKKNTRGPMLRLFIETLEKQPCKSRKPCKRRSDLVLNGQTRVPNE